MADEIPIRAPSWVGKTIESMSIAERWEAFKEEVIASVVGDFAGPGGEAALDDEEKGLLEALWRVYRMSASGDSHMDDAEWARLVRIGSLRTERDGELARVALARLVEENHLPLDSGHFRRVVDWLEKRHKPTRNLNFLGFARSDSQITPLIDTWKAFARRQERSEPLPAAAADRPGMSVTKDATPTLPPHLPDPETISPNPVALRTRVEQGLVELPLQARAIIEAVRARLSTGSLHREIAALGSFRADSESIVTVRKADLTADAEVWFAGDVHGDLLAFEAVCSVFETLAHPSAKLFLLGDLVDDGFHDREVILSLWQRMLATPGRYGWLSGNHDTGLAWSEDTRRFSSRVIPSNFEDWLNQRLDDETSTGLGRCFIEVVAGLPRALFLPGLLAAHAGFPLSDTWPDINKLSDMATPTCLGDFVWNRWSDAKRKNPNRFSNQSTFGAEDFHGFRERCEAVGFPIEGMVRGHDHMNERIERWERKTTVPRASFEGRILTINSLSFNQRRESGLHNPPNPRAPVLARWRLGQGLPTPVAVALPSDLVSWYAPTCPECCQPNATGATVCTMVRPAEGGERVCGVALHTAGPVP